MIFQELFRFNKKKSGKRISKLYTDQDIKSAKEYCVKWFKVNHDSLIEVIEGTIKSSKYSKNAKVEHSDDSLAFRFYKYSLYKHGYFISKVGYWIDPWDLDPKLRARGYESEETGATKCIKKLYKFNEKVMSPKIENWCKSKGLPGVFMYDSDYENDWDLFSVYLAIKADDIIQHIRSKGISI